MELAQRNGSDCSCRGFDVVGRPTLPATSDLIQTALVTALVVAGFAATKFAVDELRKVLSRVTVIIVGGGPIGLLSLIVAARCRSVSNIILYEEKSRARLLANNYQIAIDARSIAFLRSLAIDFDNIEGCWDKGTFYTKTGVFLEYLISSIPKLDVPLDLRLNTKFTKDSLEELELIFGRLVAVVCEGATGRASCLLGLSDEFVSEPCRSYGAVAILERQDQRSVPVPEIRVHNINFHISDVYNDVSRDTVPQGFHVKIFGTLRHRCMSIIVPRGESKTVKMLKVVLDQTVMRSIFLACYNKYKSDCENPIMEVDSVRWLKFSPRLFEVKLAHRLESVAFVEDANIFVITEGDATRRLNFHTGLDINLGIRGLTSLSKFVQMAASADTERTILQALKYKHNHSKIVTQEFLKNGIKNTMFI